MLLLGLAAGVLLALLVVLVGVLAQRLTAPVVLCTLYLLAFLPLRGLVLPQLAPRPYVNGLGLRVAFLTITGPLAPVDELVLAIVVLYSVAVLTVLLFARSAAAAHHRSARRADAAPRPDLAQLLADRRPLLRQLLWASGVGYVGTAFDLSADNFGFAGLPSGLAQAASGLGAVFLACLSATVATGRRARLLTLGAAALGLVAGSKDLLLQLALAYLVGVGLRTGFARPERGWRQAGRPLARLVAIAAGVVVLLLAVLPVVQAERASGTPLAASARTVSQTPLSQTLAASLALLTNRLHGYDSLVAAAPSAGTDRRFDPVAALLQAPVELVSSTGQQAGAQDLSQQFAQSYWGVGQLSDVHVAPSFFGQTLLSQGPEATLVVAVVLGLVLAAAQSRLGRAGSLPAVLGWLLVARTPFYLERDIGSTVVGTGRALLLMVLLVTMLPAASSRYGATTARRRARPSALRVAGA